MPGWHQSAQAARVPHGLRVFSCARPGRRVVAGRWRLLRGRCRLTARSRERGSLSRVDLLSVVFSQGGAGRCRLPPLIKPERSAARGTRSAPPRASYGVIVIAAARSGRAEGYTAGARSRFSGKSFGPRSRTLSLSDGSIVSCQPFAPPIMLDQNAIHNRTLVDRSAVCLVRRGSLYQVNY
jgi:hypothetical protein